MKSVLAYIVLSFLIQSSYSLICRMCVSVPEKDSGHVQTEYCRVTKEGAVSMKECCSSKIVARMDGVRLSLAEERTGLSSTDAELVSCINIGYDLKHCIYCRRCDCKQHRLCLGQLSKATILQLASVWVGLHSF